MNEIGNRLGIHVEEVRDAIARLQRLNFIQLNNGMIKVLSPNTTWTNNQKTSDAPKKFQKTLLQKSLEAIDHIPFGQRNNGSVTLAINSERLTEFKEKLKEMRKELATFFQADDEKNLNQVYQLTVSFFPLTKVENKIQEKENE